MFEPLYSRMKLEKRLDSLYKGAQQDISASHGKIKEHVTAKLEALSRSFKCYLPFTVQPYALIRCMLHLLNCFDGQQRVQDL